MGKRSGILHQLRKAKGWTQQQAADAMGISKGGYVKLEHGDRNLRPNSIDAAAKAFEVPRRTIARDFLSQPELIGGQAAEPDGEVLEHSRDIVFARSGGTVEAGAFRPIEDFSDAEPDPVPRPRDPDYPWATLVVFQAFGDSMNALATPILPNSILVCVDFASLRDRVPLRNGLVVVVEQRLQGGHLRERSVKQIEIFEDRVEFHPRSTNPKHKPIIVPWKMFTDETEDDGRHVEVIAIVKEISNRVGER